MEILLWGILVAILIFLVLILLPIVLKIYSTRTKAVHTAQPSVVPSTTHSSGSGFSKRLLVTGGVAAALVIVVLLIMFLKDDVAKVGQGKDMPFLVATLVVIVLAVLGAMGKAGAPGRWALAIVAILAILFVLNELMLKVSYGDQADAVREARTKRSADAILHPSQSTASAYTQASATALRQVITLSLKAGQAKPLRVTGDQCILWWGADPDGHAFTTEARHEILPPWRSWEEWQRLRAAGKVGNPGWLRFTATKGDTEVNYELRRDGEC